LLSSLRSKERKYSLAARRLTVSMVGRIGYFHTDLLTISYVKHAAQPRAVQIWIMSYAGVAKVATANSIDRKK